MQPTLRQLAYLVALAETGHFGRAAAQCAVTQSSLSAGLQELEANLEVRLVDRTKRRVALTAAGEEIVERARDILARVDDLVQSAESARAPLSGKLRLGVIPTIAPFFLPKALPRLRASHPTLRLYLREDLTARLVDLLRAGQLDLILIAFPYQAGDLETLTLFDDAFLLCTRSEDHDASQQTQPITLDTLQAENLLLLEDGHCLRDHVVDACGLRMRGAGEEGPLDAFKASSLHTLVQMVENGLGSTLIPQMALDAGILENTHLRARTFKDAQPARQIGLAWRKGSSRAEEFRLLGQIITGGMTDTAAA